MAKHKDFPVNATHVTNIFALFNPSFDHNRTLIARNRLVEQRPDTATQFLPRRMDDKPSAAIVPILHTVSSGSRR